MDTNGLKTILRRKEVCLATGLSYSTIFRLERDGKFPSRRRLSEKSVGWSRREVEEWAEKRVAVKGDQ